jgi:adenylate kinase family enzyme
MIIGSGGAGKSTFARELAKHTGLPLIHLDRYYWKPGWVPTPPEEWIECVRLLSNGDSWIMDGNYGGSLPIRVQRCDAIVFFDMPRMLCLGGILKRWLVCQFRKRPDRPEGCPEKMNATFARWVWDFPRNSRPRILAALECATPGTEMLTVTRRSHVQRVLDAVGKKAAQQATGAGR